MCLFKSCQLNLYWFMKRRTATSAEADVLMALSRAAVMALLDSSEPPETRRLLFADIVVGHEYIEGEKDQQGQGKR
jgi:hypothetical protein